jgi:transcriptional regulator GlxA family with amidase domain
VERKGIVRLAKKALNGGMKPLNVGILIFDDVEVLDVCGPFEVFSRARLTPGVESRRADDSAPFRVFCVARSKDPVTMVGGLKILPAVEFSQKPLIDIVVVPGGFGTRSLVNDAELISWIRATSAASETTASVCTGALLLAKAGLLSHRRATTHAASFDLLQSLDQTIQVQRGERVVDDVIVTSGGISAGIDMAFYLVEKICGKTVADETARYMEYRRI